MACADGGESAIIAAPSTALSGDRNYRMQALFDLAPLAAFFVAYYLGGIYVATAVLMIAMVALLLVDLLRLRRVPPMHLVSALLVLALGNVTVILRDPRFLKWKPPVLLWLVALPSLGRPWIGRAPRGRRA